MMSSVIYILISVIIAYFIFEYTLSGRGMSDKSKYAVIAGIAVNILLIIIGYNTIFP